MRDDDDDDGLVYGYPFLKNEDLVLGIEQL